MKLKSFFPFLAVLSSILVLCSFIPVLADQGSSAAEGRNNHDLEEPDSEPGGEVMAPVIGETTTEFFYPYDSGSLSPQASSFSGALGQSLPIEVPPGRGGISPNLSLSYNSFQKTTGSFPSLSPGGA